MDWIIRLLPGRQMAACIAAIRRLDRQAVVAIDMAEGALHIGMAVGQQKAGGAVVEFAVRPLGDGVAGGACRGAGRESRGHVVGNTTTESLRLVPIGCMAGQAIRGCEGVVVVHMALRAGRRGVGADQRKAGRVVIERCGIPAQCCVAGGAISQSKRRARRGVHRIIRLLPGRKVATRGAAGRRGDLQIVIVVYVAGGAGHIGVPICKQKSGRAVIECRPQPAVKFVAPLAIARRKRRPGAGVRGIGRVLPIFQMAGIARSAQSQENPRCGLLVAFIALNRGMSAQERKAVLVIAHLLHGDVPTLHRVALRAVRPHLTTVNVGVAIGAIFAHVREYGLCVALRALHFFVLPAKRIFGFVVIEFGNRADGSPAG